MTPAPFTPAHRADLERYATKLRLAHWAAEGDKLSRPSDQAPLDRLLDTGMGFPEAVEELHRRLTGPVPVPDPDTEWR